MATEARQAARVRLIWVYSVVKDYGSRAGTDLLAAERAELQVTAWVMRRKRRDKEQAEEMSGGYFHRHESQNWLPHVVAAIASSRPPCNRAPCPPCVCPSRPSSTTALLLLAAAHCRCRLPGCLAVVSRQI